MRQLDGLKPGMNVVRSLLIAFLLLAVPAAAQEIGTLTLVEGPLRLIRGASVFKGAEGVRVRAGDILESSDSGFVQVEFNGGMIAALGGASRVVLRGRGTGSAQELVLVSGWLKSQIPGSASETYRYDSPLLSASAQNGSLVLHSTTDGAEVFVESGAAHVSEVATDGRARAPQNAKAGQFYSRAPDKNVAASARPSSAFVGGMPQPFRDTFPSLLSRFAGKPQQPKRDHDVTYAEIQPYLTMRSSWREGMVRRFQARLQDPAFRKAVEAHLREHPEWTAAVRGDTAKPKTAAAAAGNLDRPSDER